MSGQLSPHLLVAAVHAIPALVWALVAQELWRFIVARRPRSRLYGLIAVAASLMALHYILHCVMELTPSELEGRASGLHRACDAVIALCVVAAMPLFRHMVPLLPVPEMHPSWRWLVVNYGSAVAVGAVTLLPILLPGWFVGDARLPSHLVSFAYVMVMSFLALNAMRRLPRRGTWRPGMSDLRSPDFVIMTAVLLAAVGMMLALLAAGYEWQESIWALFLHTAVGLGLALPFVVRMLGETIRLLLNVAAMVGMTAAALGLHAAAGRLASAEGRQLVDVAALLLLLLGIGPGQLWMRAAIERVVFRRSRHRRSELLAFVHTLSPDLGTLECCRQALAALTRIMQVPGAAVMLADGGAVAHGTFDLEGLVRRWPRGREAAVLPPFAFVLGEARELPLPLSEALIEADVAWVAPITSPRQHWGHLFATEGFLSAHFSAEDLEALTAFMGQLALVLDAAALLARAVAVERSLAHAEKLAAIGEISARIAHEIRNPITAARSLAQQLHREATAPLAADHAGIILTELERVERQVAALLRFARREEFRFEEVELGGLVRGTVETFRARLEAAQVEVGMDLTDGLVARADREKLRQVLINLIENALDALHDAPRERRLSLALQGLNGSALLDVADSGPGVAAESLPHLFEPFFSLKENGTGLGLAIVKRTIDAHGGRIAARSHGGRGLSVHVELPLVERA